MADMSSQPDRKTHTHFLLERIGGQAAIAKECDVTESAVSQWATEDRLPKPRAQYLRIAHPGPHWDQYDATRVATSDDHAPAAKQPPKAERAEQER